VHCRICICSYSIEEFHRVVERKFPENKSDAVEFLTNLEFELIASPVEMCFERLPYIRDEKDYPILQAAIAANIELLLTGDKDFHDVRCRKLKILGPTEFARRLPLIR
jgi:predicted nucleic acid-binding protein